MNYSHIYAAFIADRRIKEAALIASGAYSEKHHILPRAHAGDNTPSNLIRLTPEDHFFAHLLLAKIYGGKMWYALMAMCVDWKGNRSKDAGYLNRRRKSYAIARAGHSKAMKEVAAAGLHHTQTPEWRANKSIELKAKAAAGLIKSQTLEGKAEMRAITNARIAAGTGPSQSAEARKKTAERMTGRVVSEETRHKIAVGNLGKKMSTESRAKMSASHKSRELTPEQRAYKAEVCRAQIWTEERREKVRQSNRTRGVSEQTKAKISAAHKARGDMAERNRDRDWDISARDRLIAFHAAKKKYAEDYGVPYMTITKAMIEASNGCT